MGNRKQPFGYKMSLGKIVIQESEAKLVQEIFLRYIAGESLNELTESLRQQDIPYDEGRLWNKNMVARILADIRYTGEKGYPKLIDEEQLIAANEKRSNKPQLPKKTEAQKVLRRLCGTPTSERVELLTIHQTIPVNGIASLTLSVDILPTTGDSSEMIEQIERLKGVRYLKILSSDASI